MASRGQDGKPSFCELVFVCARSLARMRRERTGSSLKSLPASRQFAAQRRRSQKPRIQCLAKCAYRQSLTPIAGSDSSRRRDCLPCRPGTLAMGGHCGTTATSTIANRLVVTTFSPQTTLLTPKTVIQALDSTTSDVFTITTQNIPNLPRAIELAVLLPDRFYLETQTSLGLCPGQGPG